MGVPFTKDTEQYRCKNCAKLPKLCIFLTND